MNDGCKILKCVPVWSFTFRFFFAGYHEFDAVEFAFEHVAEWVWEGVDELSQDLGEALILDQEGNENGGVAVADVEHRPPVPVHHIHVQNLQHAILPGLLKAG